MRPADFESLSDALSKGADIASDEMADALVYASDAWNEIRVLTRSLCAGYYALKKEIERKNRTIEQKSRTIALADSMLKAQREELARLREKVKEAEQGAD